MLRLRASSQGKSRESPFRYQLFLGDLFQAVIQKKAQGCLFLCRTSSHLEAEYFWTDPTFAKGLHLEF